MLGSLYSGVSGLSVHQTKMNVIGNNIANINTYGFKASRVTFTDVFYQTLSSATASSSSVGGTNSSQLGHGAAINSIDVINTQAGSTTTNRTLDLYINGDGYLAVQDSSGAVKYTRVGILSFDSSGNLVDSGGNKVLGLPVNSSTGKVSLDSDGTTSVSNLSAISVDPDVYAQLTSIAIGDDGAITATMGGDPAVTLSSGTGWISSASISSDSDYTDELNVTTTTTATGFTAESGVTTTSSATNLNMLGDVTVSYDGTSTYTLSYTKTDGTTATVTSDDGDFTVTDLSGNDATFTVDSADLPSDSSTTTTLGTFAATAKTITATTYDQSGNEVSLSSTWTSGSTSISLGDITLTVDSSTFGALSDLTDSQIGDIGTGDSTSVTLGYIALAKFANADGLSQDGNGYYVTSANSGEAVATSAGSSGTGSLVSGALESSNVDLSQELTEMIVTQRGFQANSKIITVSDEMLETLVSMKR